LKEAIPGYLLKRSFGYGGGFVELEDRVTCDISGCSEELPVGSEIHPSELVRGHGEWAFVGGLVLCPEHAQRRPWLS
jgi:hypothetical protein